MSIVSPERLSNIIGSIYDCVLAPDQWPAALSAIVEEYNFDNSAITVHDLATAQMKLHVTVGTDDEWTGAAQRFETEILELWGGSARIAGYPLEEPLIQSEVTPRNTWASNAYYMQVLRPRRLHDCATIALVRDPMTIGAVAFGQHEKDGEISERSVEALRLIAPHLRRAVVIGRLFEQKAAIASTFSAVLEAIAAGVVLVDAKMNIVHANAAAEAMLKTGDPIQGRGGKLAISNTLANSVLVNAVSQAALQEADLERRSIDIPIRRADGAPTVAQVLPLRRRTVGRGVEQRTVAAVFIANAANPPRPPC